MNLQDAFYNTVHDAPGGAESLAPRMGVSAQILRNKANPNNPGNIPSLDEADKLITLTGDLRILHAMAARHGMVCAPKPNGHESDLAILEIIAAAWRSGGNVGESVYTALVDGRISGHELDTINLAIYNAQQSLATVGSRLQGMADK